MPVASLARPVRRLLTAAIAALLILAGLTAGPFGARPAYADDLGHEYFMLVNNYYDGVHAGSTMMCLSTNHQQSPSGAGTFYLYLTKCDTSGKTATQWWEIGEYSNVAITEVLNWGAEATGTGDYQCLSTNLSTPPGGFAGTHGAYTSYCNGNGAQSAWRVNKYTGGTNEYTIDNYLVSPLWSLSTTATNPYPGGGYQVYTSSQRTPPAAAQVWRLYHPTNPPGCPQEYC